MSSLRLLSRSAKYGRTFTRRRFRPVLERLEDRWAPAVGIFFEDFGLDTNRNQPGWDSWDSDSNTQPPTGPDELLISNDFPFTATNGPTRTGGYAAIQSLPGPYGPQVLTMTRLTDGDTRSDPQIIFSFTPSGTLGGPAADEEVAVAAVDVKGYGTVTFVGARTAQFLEGPRLSFRPSDNLTWEHFSVTRESVVNHAGTPLGAIQQIIISGGEVFDVNRISALVLVKEGPPPNVIANGDFAHVSQRQHDRSVTLNWRQNDVDLDGDPLSLVRFTRPRHGRVIMEGAAGTARYTPNLSYLGQDSFSYTVRDPAGHTATAVVTIEVTNNLPPVPISTYIAADHGVPLPLHGSLEFVDPDGDPVTAIIVDEPDFGVITGLRTVNGHVEVEYWAPSSRAMGPDVFSLRLFDGREYSDPVRVEVRVPNSAPIANAREIFIGASQFPPSSANDVVVFHVLPSDDPEHNPLQDWEPDGDPLEAQLLSGPSAGEIVSFSGDGVVAYRPWGTYDDYAGDHMTIRITDGLISREAEVFVYNASKYFGPENMPVPNGWYYLLPAGSFINVPASGGVLLGNSDYLDATIVTPPEHAFVEHHEDGTVTNHFQLNTDGSFVYQPDPSFVGVDHFWFTHKYDHFRVITSPVLMASLVVLNQPPEPQADSYWVARNGRLVVPASFGVQKNDVEPNHQPMTVDHMTAPSHGRIVRFLADGSFIYEPTRGYNGQDTFQYRVVDGYGGAAYSTVTVNVAGPATGAGDAENVVTPGGDFVTLLSSAGTTLENVRVSATLPPGAPSDLPLGYFQFEIRGVPRGGDATVRLLLPAGGPAVNDYWKFGPTADNHTPHWYRFVYDGTTGAEFRHGEIILHFVDGGLGDAPVRDGRILDPGGPVFSSAHAQGVVVNDGARQRSMVTSLTVQFSEVVTFDPGAFELRALRGGGLVDLNVATSLVDGRTVATLTFSGTGNAAGSLADGRYLLTVHGDRAHSTSGGALDGDLHASLFRLFGDADADGDVDVRDIRTFVGALLPRPGPSGYLAYLDADGDGDIDRADLREFLLRVGRRLPA